MRTSYPIECLVLGAVWAAFPSSATAMFRTQEIGRDLGVVYAVGTADINRDGKPDIVAINHTQVFWFENPKWDKHVILDGVTKKDNVCFATEDIDGDGFVDVALGADWQPTNTEGGGSLQWIRRDNKKPTGPWALGPISLEPTLHRIRWGDVNGDGKNELVVVPLHGRGNKGPAWTGAGARILVFNKPRNPLSDPWPVEIADETLHIVHNFIVVDGQILAAAREGVFALARDARGRWSKRQIGEGNPGEIKLGKVSGTRTLATIEPWHGTTLVTLRERSPIGGAPAKLWEREVVDPTLIEGHAIGWGDFDGDGSDELVAGWRKPPVGVALYKRSAGRATPGKPGAAWQKAMIDEGGMAAEDLVVADLNGDGRPEVIAGGRATANVRIYWND
jgi:hypothetical protein